jgi:hypothetical protein
LNYQPPENYSNIDLFNISSRLKFIEHWSVLKLRNNGNLLLLGYGENSSIDDVMSSLKTVLMFNSRESRVISTNPQFVSDPEKFSRIFLHPIKSKKKKNIIFIEDLHLAPQNFN